MVLTPLQSWLLLLVLAAGMGVVIWAASRPGWSHRRKHRLHDQQLRELERYERARARLEQIQTENRGYIRLSHPRPRREHDDA